MTKRILLVEDNPANMELVRYLLAAVGHEVAMADDGQQALEKAKASSYDLIISDLQMPVMDGYELIAALRRIPQGGSVPAMALTALSMPGDEKRILAAGFDFYMSKPIEPEAFLAKVASILGGTEPDNLPTAAGPT